MTKNKNLILKIATLLTMLACIVITFLGSTFKPMKNTYADEGNNVQLHESLLFYHTEVTDLRALKVGDDLSGKTLYIAPDYENFISDGFGISFVKPVCYDASISGNMPSMLSCKLVHQGGGFRICSINNDTLAVTGNKLVLPEVTTCNDLSIDEYVQKCGEKYSLIIESLPSESYLQYFAVSSAEMGDVVDEPTEEPNEEPTDKTPGFIEQIGDGILDYFEGITIGGSVVVGFGFIIIVILLLTRKK